MRLGNFLGKSLLILAVAVLATGCSCRTRKVGAENIDLAEAGKELKDVGFSFDSYALDATAKSVLQKNAEWLQANPDRAAEVQGHCDERGTNEYNMALGSKRANAAMNQLVALGVAADRLSTVSYGEELPLDPGHNESAWAKNRRAHFKLTK